MFGVFALLSHGEDRALLGWFFLYLLVAAGALVWVSITTSAIRTSSRRVLYGIAQVEDISAPKAGETELRHQAAHDPLTGLPNRSTLNDRLATAVNGARAGGEEGAVLFCDLDGFKAVNDTPGA